MVVNREALYLIQWMYITH